MICMQELEERQRALEMERDTAAAASEDAVKALQVKYELFFFFFFLPAPEIPTFFFLPARRMTCCCFISDILIG
jgi:hypothetical protein